MVSYLVPQKILDKQNRVKYGNYMFRESITKPYGDKIGGAEPVRYQKCGNSIGYITILSKG
jgi:hypothetical protein